MALVEDGEFRSKHVSMRVLDWPSPAAQAACGYSFLSDHH